MSVAGRFLCALGLHPVARKQVWNAGYCFSGCTRCRRDLVRSASGTWHVPRGYRVVWLPRDQENGEPAAAAADRSPRRGIVDEPQMQARDTPEPIARETVEPAAPSSPEPGPRPAATAPCPPAAAAPIASRDFMEDEESDESWAIVLKPATQRLPIDGTDFMRESRPAADKPLAKGAAASLR